MSSHDNRSVPANSPEARARLSDADYAAHVDAVTAEIKARNGVADRVCGECTACCTVMAVPELSKINYQPCSHDCGTGCAIYDSRPRRCRSWSCSWLLGRIEGDEGRRPDRLGLVFSIDELAGKRITVASEVWPGAAKEPNKLSLLRQMSEKMPIVTRQYQTRECDVITADPQLRQTIHQLIQDEWYAKLYGQIVVSNFPAK